MQSSAGKRFAIGLAWWIGHGRGEYAGGRSRRGDWQRRAMRLAYANAAIWAIGNGLVSSTLIVYLALSVGARNFQSAIIYAAPSLAGTLRLAVPMILARFGRRKAFCIAAYVASALVLSLVPIAAAYLADGHPRAGGPRLRLVHLSSVRVLWHGGALVVDRRSRAAADSRAVLRLSGALAGERAARRDRLHGCARVDMGSRLRRAVPACSRSRCRPLAVRCSCCSPSCRSCSCRASNTCRAPCRALPWRAVVRAMSQRPYRQLVLFSCVFSFVNGITQAAQGTYPRRVLDVSYQGLQTIVATMRAGQMALAPTMGRWCDAFGSRPVMILSQLVVATGPLFLFMATRERWWWLVGAYVAWIAYAGLNVGLDNIKLKLAPADNNVALSRRLLLDGRLDLRLVDPARPAGCSTGSRIAASTCSTSTPARSSLGWLGRTLVVGAAGADRRAGRMARARRRGARRAHASSGNARRASREPTLVECLARLGVVFAGDGEAAVRLRRAIVLRREGLGVFRREGPVDRPLELLILVDVDEVVGRRRGPAVFVDLLVVGADRHRRRIRFLRSIVRQPSSTWRAVGDRFVGLFVEQLRDAAAGFVAGVDCVRRRRLDPHSSAIGIDLDRDRYRLSSSSSRSTSSSIVVVDEVELVVVQIFIFVVVGSHERRFLLPVRWAFGPTFREVRRNA